MKRLVLVGLIAVLLTGCKVQLGNEWFITIGERGWSDGLHGWGIDIFPTAVPL
jgi:hypothetical protein